MSECYAPEPVELPETGTVDVDLPPTPDSSYTDSEFLLVDVDGDGYTETTLIDSNDDGEVDAVLTDVDGDFYDDVAQFDNAPGDGVFTADVVAIAEGADGLADTVLDDTDLDGVFETVTPGGDEPLAYANPYELSAGVAPTAYPQS